MSLRDELIAAMQATAARKPRAVETEAWGTVYVRDITVAEVDEQQAEEQEDEDDKRTRIARGAARIICDAEGNRIFDPESKADVELLASQPWPLLSAVIS